MAGSCQLQLTDKYIASDFFFIAFDIAFIKGFALSPRLLSLSLLQSVSVIVGRLSLSLCQFQSVSDSVYLCGSVCLSVCLSLSLSLSLPLFLLLTLAHIHKYTHIQIHTNTHIHKHIRFCLFTEIEKKCYSSIGQTLHLGVLMYKSLS